MVVRWRNHRRVRDIRTLENVNPALSRQLTRSKPAYYLRIVYRPGYSCGVVGLLGDGDTEHVRFARCALHGVTHEIGDTLWPEEVDTPHNSTSTTTYRRYWHPLIAKAR